MDVSDRRRKSDSSARCARCGVAFDCGGSTRPFECWCAGMPALPWRAPAAGEPPARCLCPACYADALAASGGSSEPYDPSTSDTPNAAVDNSTV